ncbi:hypothetical protein MG295_00207 [Bacillus phage vB_BcgM]|nr:hypothetical protein MG295_00207 [Bacillus phage vB_BcgM]
MVRRQQREDNGWRKGNSNKKRLLEGIGFKNTTTSFLKEWLHNRVHCNEYVEGDVYPVKVCYDKFVGCFKSWADACYHVAMIELKKGKRV